MKITDKMVEDAIAEGGMVGWDYIEDRMRDALAAALPHLPLGYEVKKLEWGKTSYGTPEIFTEVGVYRIMNAFNGGCSLNRNNKSIASYDGRLNFADEKNAKAAAQDDFERRVRECLVDKPVDVAAVRRQAFEEGFENGVEQSLNALDAYDDITRNEAEQAISKLKPDYRALSHEIVGIAPYHKDLQVSKKASKKAKCPFCGRPSIDRCAMRDWAWYPCDWEKSMKGQQHDK